MGTGKLSGEKKVLYGSDTAHTTDQKVVIIIGGSSGIGRATAAGLAKEGVKVVVAPRRTKEREETVRLISKAESYGDLCR